MKLNVLLFLILAFLVYLFIGAGIFYAIEKPLENQRCNEATSYVNSLLNNNSLQNNINITRIELMDIITVCTQLLSAHCCE